MNIQNLINYFKIDIYMEVASRDYIIEAIQKTFPGASIFTGQKRIVVIDPSNPGQVYKIAHTWAGIMDNIHEVATSNRLLELSKMNTITQDDLRLFALAQLTSERDPFIITQEFVMHYDQDQTFRQWLQSSTANPYGAINENQSFPIYCSTVSQYINDYNRIQQIMAEFFVPSDITLFKEPKNFGIRNGRLSLLDMGSVVPLFVDPTGQPIRPVYMDNYTNCPMKYVAALLQPNMTIAQVTNLTSAYMRMDRNEGMTLVSSGDANVMQIDDAVFDMYIRNHINEYSRMLIISGLWYQPNIYHGGQQIITINNIQDYMNKLQSDFGFMLPEECNLVMWKNYIFRRMCNHLHLCPEVVQLQVFYTDQTNRTVIYTYQEFFQLIVNMFKNKNLAIEDSSAGIISAIFYLRGIASMMQNPFEALDSCNPLLGYETFHANISRLVPAFAQDRNLTNTIWKYTMGLY